MEDICNEYSTSIVQEETICIAFERCLSVCYLMAIPWSKTPNQVSQVNWMPIYNAVEENSVMIKKMKLTLNWNIKVPFSKGERYASDPFKCLFKKRFHSSFLSPSVLSLNEINKSILTFPFTS